MDASVNEWFEGWILRCRRRHPMATPLPTLTEDAGEFYGPLVEAFDRMGVGEAEADEASFRMAQTKPPDYVQHFTPRILENIRLIRDRESVHNRVPAGPDEELEAWKAQQLPRWEALDDQTRERIRDAVLERNPWIRDPRTRELRAVIGLTACLAEMDKPGSMTRPAPGEPIPWQGPRRPARRAEPTAKAEATEPALSAADLTACQRDFLLGLSAAGTSAFDRLTVRKQVEILDRYRRHPYGTDEVLDQDTDRILGAGAPSVADATADSPAEGPSVDQDGPSGRDLRNSSVAERAAV